MSNPVGTQFHAKADHSFKMIIDGQKWKFKVYDLATGSLVNVSQNLGVLETVAREGIKGSLAITQAAGASSKTVERIQFNVTNVIADTSTSELKFVDSTQNPHITDVAYNSNPGDKAAFKKAEPSSPPDITKQINTIKDAILNPKAHPATEGSKSAQSSKSSRSKSSSSSEKSGLLPKTPKHYEPKGKEIEKSNTQLLTAFLKARKIAKGSFDETKLITQATSILNHHLPEGAKPLTDSEVQKQIQKRLGKLKISDRPEELKSAIQEVFKEHHVNLIHVTENKGRYTLTPALSTPLNLEKTAVLVSSNENMTLVSGTWAEKELHATKLKQEPFAIENGAKGDCAVKALAGAQMLNRGAWIENNSTRQALHQAQGLEIRREVTTHMRENSKEYFSEIRQFQTALKNQAVFTDGADNTQLTTLCEKDETELTPKEKTFIVQTYAAYASKPGVWLDGPFFLGFAKKYGVDVAIVTGKEDKYQITSTFRKNGKDRPIDKSGKETLFIYYNGTDHYQIFNIVRSKITSKDDARLSQMIRNRNTSEKPQRVRRALLEALSQKEPDTKKIKAELFQLKRNDMQAYLTLRELAEDEIAKLEGSKGRSTPLILKLKQELGAKTHSELAHKLEQRINRNSHFQARAAFYDAFKMHDEHEVAPAVLELKEKDPELYLTLQELLGGLTPEDHPRHILEMYRSSEPDWYFEKELKKRPYLEARAAFFATLNKHQEGDGYQTSLETAISSLAVDDQQTYLTLKALTDVNSDEASEIAEALIDNSLKEDQIQRQNLGLNRVALKEYSAAVQDQSPGADERLKAVMIKMKKQCPAIAIYHSELQKSAKPEENLQAIRNNPVFNAVTDQQKARNTFFTAHALHEFKGGPAYSRAMLPALLYLQAHDPQGYQAVHNLVTLQIQSKNPIGQLTPEQLADRSEILKKITLDDVQEYIHQ